MEEAVVVKGATETTSIDPQTDVMLREYQQGIDLLKHWSTVRRQDIVFVTTAQGAVLTIIGKSLPLLNAAQYALTVIAAFVIVLGINTERRLAAYSDGYVKRVKALEAPIGIALLSAGAEEVDKQRFLSSNKRMFLTYYGVLLIGWIGLWMSNIIEWLAR